jgi:tetratricopeptide (TPR) repeat protein
MPRGLARRIISLLAFFLFIGVAPLFSQEATPPAAADDAYQAQRKFAMALLNQQKHMEALPVFESLAKQNPNDADVLFGWGACLVNHSATVADPEAARQERIHARQLLVRAKELGNKSGVLLNLLDMLPEDGSVGFSSASESDAAMRAGEAAFAKNEYDEAIKHYSRALELDPQKYHAALFVGDSYFAKKDFPNAIVWYDRAIVIDPNMETAYRYEADLLIKSGEMEKARNRSIQAVVANPYTQITWRSLAYWANSNHVQLNTVHINTPSTDSKDGQTHITVNMDSKDGPGARMLWIVYSGVRVQWQKEDFKKHFPNAKEYRHSLAEETEALNLVASGFVDEGKNHKKQPPPSDPDLTLLLKLYSAKMIEPYILISAPDRDIAMNDYVPYREQHRDQLVAYLSQFIVPPTPAKP